MNVVVTTVTIIDQEDWILIMNKKFFALGLGVSAASLALVAGPALATGLSTNVSVGGSSAAGSHPITAASTGTLTFAAEKTAAAGGGYLSMTCASANVTSSPTASTVFSGTGLTDIANLAKVNFLTCTGPGGKLTVTTTPNWKLHRDGGTPTAAATDSIPGHIDSISATATNPLCTFTVTGKAAGNFNEATQQLVVNETAAAAGNLTVSVGASSCGGQLLNGGKAKFSGTFNVTSPDGVINVLP